MRRYLSKLVARTLELREELAFGHVSNLDAPELSPQALQHLLLAAACLDAVLAHLQLAGLHMPRPRKRTGRSK